jgi:hypothetical protein
MLVSDPILRTVYAPNGTIAEKGRIIKNNNLATTLELISKYGADEFYTVSIVFFSEIFRGTSVLYRDPLPNTWCLTFKTMEGF